MTALPENLCVGHAVADDEHRALLVLVERLGADLKAGKPAAVIQERAILLHGVAAAHFAGEEQAMARIDLPAADAAAHCADHRRLQGLLEQFIALFDDERRAAGVDSAEAARFLEDWLAIHIRTYDREMAEASARPARRSGQPSSSPG